MALYGGAIFGPAATLWYQQLQKRVKIPGSPNLEILARVGVDQTVFASTNLFLFLSSMAIMEGSDPKKKLESSYLTALQKNWMVWPAVQFTNFKFVPLEHRVMVVNVVSIGELSGICIVGIVVLTLRIRLELLPQLFEQCAVRRPREEPDVSSGRLNGHHTFIYDI